MAQLAKNIKKFNQEFVIDSSGGAIGLNAWQTANLILAYNGASVVTLPEASTCIGYRVRILAGYAGDALVTITPHTDDHIDLLAANTSIFLNNSDGGANVQKFRHVELMAIASGYWAVISGDFCPDQAVDTDGSHLCLGRLHRLPLDNTSDRELCDLHPSATSAWTSAISAAGLKGIPNGAKGIKVRVVISIAPASTGTTTFYMYFSDNNANVPSIATSHPMVSEKGYLQSGVNAGSTYEIDIPLDASGQFYIRWVAPDNVTVASSFVWVTALGYYMGD